MTNQPSDLKAIGAGFVLGVIAMWMLSQSEHGIGNMYYSAIAECEANLPSDIKCKVTGVPVHE